jgi:hypothetical protein
MKPKSFLIKTASDQARAKFAIDSLVLTEGPYAFDLRVEKHEKLAEMQALYRIRNRELSRGLDESYTPEEIHKHFLQTKVFSIMERDNLDFKQRLDSYRELWQKGMKHEAEKLAEIAKRTVSTTWLNQTQWQELLTEQERFAAEMGIYLQEPPTKEEK